MRNIGKRTWLLAVLSGALQVLMFPAPALDFLCWIALAPLFYALLHSYADRPLTVFDPRGKPVGVITGRQAFLLGWLAWFVWSMGSCHWVYFTMVHYGGLPPVVSIGLLILFSLTLALFNAFFSLFLVRVATRFGLRWALVAAPFLWVAVEWSRTVLVGFPWLLLGTVQVDNIPFTGIAAGVGVYGLSFAIVLVNAAFAAALLAPRERRRSLLLAAASAAVVLQLGVIVKPPPSPADRTATLVQQNIPILEGGSWTYDFYDRTLGELSQLSLSAGAAPAGAPGLIVWPESPAPFFVSEPRFRSALAGLARESNSYILAGSLSARPQVRGVEKEELYNSAVFIAPAGQVLARYDKIHLVPFGEYVPFQKLLFFAEKLTREVGDFVPGAERSVFRAPQGALGTFICYESIFPNEIRQFAAGGAGVFVNISNDGWFGHTGAPEQHLNMARMRAIENRRWLLRDTNTGITASIDPYGRIVARAPRGTRTVLVAPYAFAPGTTFYTRHGDWFAWLCVIISLGALVLRFRLRAGMIRNS